MVSCSLKQCILHPTGFEILVMDTTRSFFFMIRAALLLFLVSTLQAGAQNAGTADSFNFAGFGTVHVYHPSAAPNSVVLFLSGDGGWEKIVMDMANALREAGALVATVDVPHYLHAEAATSEKCFYPAGDLEALSQAVQQRAGLPVYQLPILAGYSSGASLVYVALAQAPVGTFVGGISLGFCQDLECTQALCRGNGLACHRVTKPAAWLLEPDPALTTPWYVLHGQIDQCCTLAHTRDFVAGIPAARLTVLPKVGHGYAVEKNWLPQFQQTFRQLLAENAPQPPPLPAALHSSGTSAVSDTESLLTELEDWLWSNPTATAEATLEPAQSLADLPLTETLARAGAASNRLVVFISGDGGWKDFDQQIADGLGAQGMPVVGLNALKYFWTTRTPEGAAWDLTRILTEYEQKWGKKEVVLVGYSFGGDVLPFLFNRLPDEQKHRVKGLVMLSPSPSAEFTFHFSSWANKASTDAQPVKPELAKMLAYPTLFLFGSDEDPAWVRPLAVGNFQLKVLTGGHHYGGNTSAIDAAIAGFLQQR